MSEMSKFDQAIFVINTIFRKKRKRIEELSQRVDINENQRMFIDDENQLMTNVDMLVKQCKDTFHEHLGKIPPQDNDLEIAVLGAAILENTGFEKVKTFLKPEHFHNESHRIIWQASLIAGEDQAFHFEKDRDGDPIKIYDNPVDMRLVIAQLRKMGKLEEAGGVYYIAELTSKVVSSANIVSHARILIENATKRELIKMAGNLLHNAYSDESDCFELLDTSEEQFKRIRAWIK